MFSVSEWREHKGRWVEKGETDPAASTALPAYSTCDEEILQLWPTIQRVLDSLGRLEGAHLEQPTVWGVSRDGEIIACPNGRHDEAAAGLRLSRRNTINGLVSPLGLSIGVCILDRRLHLSKTLMHRLERGSCRGIPTSFSPVLITRPVNTQCSHCWIR